MPTRVSLTVFLALACCLSVMTLAHAATFNVTTTGSDSGNNSCTASAPCRSVGHATSVMHGSDTLIIHAGTYNEGNISLPNGTTNNPTIMKANPGDTVILQPKNTAIDCIYCLKTG